MAPFRRAERHRPAAHPQRASDVRRAVERTRRTLEREYLLALRHLR